MTKKRINLSFRRKIVSRNSLGRSWTCLSLRDRNILAKMEWPNGTSIALQGMCELQAVNLVRRLPGVRQNLEFESPVSAWRLFFTTDILDDIVTHTNQRIQKVRSNFTRERDAKYTTGDELEAFIRLLYMAGILRASHLNLYDLWATDGTGVEFFRNCMNLKSFKFLIRVIRFDDARTRLQRKALDKVAPIRDLFETLVEKCKANIAVSEYLTIDEMLEAFRCRCGFRQYIKNKPARY